MRVFSSSGFLAMDNISSLLSTLSQRRSCPPYTKFMFNSVGIMSFPPTCHCSQDLVTKRKKSSLLDLWYAILGCWPSVATTLCSCRSRCSPPFTPMVVPSRSRSGSDCWILLQAISVLFSTKVPAGHCVTKAF